MCELLPPQRAPLAGSRHHRRVRAGRGRGRGGWASGGSRGLEGSFLVGGRVQGAALPSWASSPIPKDLRSPTGFKITPELVKLQKRFCRARALFLRSRRSRMSPERGWEVGAGFPFGKAGECCRGRVAMGAPREGASGRGPAPVHLSHSSRWPTAVLCSWGHTHTQATAHLVTVHEQKDAKT